MSTFWNRRVVPYSVGALEFLQNLVSNVRDAVRASSTSDTQDPPGDFSGKVCIVTGANAGIGRSTAAAIFQRGGVVVLACRSRSRGEQAVQALQQMQPASGIMAPPVRSETEDGLEQQFQVNFLGHWRLVHDLVANQASLRRPRKAPAQHTADSDGASLRVIWLTSMTHVGAHLDFKDLQLRKGYSGFLGYANTKLAGILAIKEFQQRMDRCNGRHQQKAVFCSVHPGFVNTDLANGWLTGSDVVPAAVQQIIRPLVRAICPWILVSPSKAVQTILYAASAPSAEISGKYIAGGKVVQPSRQAQDDQLSARLWEASQKLSDTAIAPCFQ
ncbi:hypothetical protein WJX73_005150 [Symbiochloris irregularis]|uniref:Uncharacterized protein n=1 Tax=Symbiochloris irregularis TaxID=706552 RepID=A0AAW1P5L5_9CHLO